MVINFRIHEISRDMHKLTRTPTLIIVKKDYKCHKKKNFLFLVRYLTDNYCNHQNGKQSNPNLLVYLHGIAYVCDNFLCQCCRVAET
jgi:hypothetical protein